jgi:hypothetical protein
MWHIDLLLSGDPVNSSRCLVTAAEHINNTRAIARQLLSKRVPVAMDMHAMVEVLLGYNTENNVFFLWFMLKYYKQGQLSSRIDKPHWLRYCHCAELEIRHNLLYWTWTDKGPVYILYTFINMFNM